MEGGGEKEMRERGWEEISLRTRRFGLYFVPVKPVNPDYVN